ncbi:hypothetical protein [Gloeocapsopsis dulcis]|uniref:hypothetical protein n=1 Tax=Gloeocapsopsis dulcis TaxID=2859516 RepID=UPI0018C52A9C|nr:hypothetical protein [Gloeocapsopsis dulcis]WNN91401.1 hypothetical protein P0S91_10150 [Gloeocapsopsis dulcis]
MMKRMYLEGKVLELLALLIDQEIQYCTATASPRRLKSNDVERIHLAKDILSKQIADPPSLRQLARMSQYT